MVVAWFPIMSSCNPAYYIWGLIHGIGRGVPNGYLAPSNALFHSTINEWFQNPYLAYPEKDIAKHADKDQKQKSAEQTDRNTDRAESYAFFDCTHDT